MCGINNDITTRARVDRSRQTGQCNNGGDNNNSQPLNLFQGDTLGNCRGSGLFPRQAGGSGGIEDLLARLSKKDKNNSLDTTNAANGLFSGGKDFGSATGRSDEGGGGGGQALGQAMQGIQQVLGAVMNIVKAVMGIFGGL
ncbi:MAG: hypothetical protein HYS27_28470 [Deltaproteobacteria bacterium]|nr:hypothetical protein [Deltaproteobacteria bacterium]